MSKCLFFGFVKHYTKNPNETQKIKQKDLIYSNITTIFLILKKFHQTQQYSIKCAHKKLGILKIPNRL
jgi:hypothetical protein